MTATKHCSMDIQILPATAKDSNTVNDSNI